MLRVILDPEADKDIEAEFAYLAERSIQVALRFLQSAEDTFDQLAEIPNRGTMRQFEHPDLAGIRMWPIRDFPNYLAFYQISEDSLRVLRVLHGSRNIERILEQGAQTKQGDTP